MTIKNILLVIFTGLALNCAQPTFTLENSMASKAMQIVSNNKGKLALAGTLFASYQLYKKYQKELKPFMDKVKLEKDHVFWENTSRYMYPNLIYVSQLYLTLKNYKFLENKPMYYEILMRLCINIATQLPFILSGINNSDHYKKLFYETPFSLAVIISGGSVNAILMATQGTPNHAIKLLDFLIDKYKEAIEKNDYVAVKFYSYIIGTNCYHRLGERPVDIAARNNKNESVKALLSRYDCVVDESQKDLIIKCGLAHLETLIKNGESFDPNMKIQEVPVIICAAINNKSEMVKFLLENNADTTVKDLQGKTIYDYLNEKPEMQGAENIKAILKEYRSKIADKVQETTQEIFQDQDKDLGNGLIPDVANIISEYVVLIIT